MNDKTLYVEDALQFLMSYHELNYGRPKPRLQTLDNQKIESLAFWSMSTKPFTEKQGKLAMMFVRKYRKCLESAGFDVSDIVDENRFKLTPTKTVVIPKIVCIENRDNMYMIDICFPYDEYLISTIKNQSSGENSKKFIFDSHDKKWSAELNISNAFFAYDFGKKNCFFIDEDFQKYIDRLKEEKKKARLPQVKFENGKLVFESLFEKQKEAIEQEFRDL